MRFARVVFCFVLAVSQLNVLLPPTKAAAADSPGLFLISEIETTGTSVSGTDVPAEEFIKLTNISGDTLEINGWKLDYINSSNNESLIVGFDGMVLPYGSVLVAHDGYPLPAGVTADKYFSSGTTSVLAKTVGQVRLVDSVGHTADLVGWGSASVATPWPKLGQIPPGFSAKRIIQGHPLFGTGLDYTWDVASQPLIPLGGAFVPDVCPNISGAQPTLLSGYGIDGSGLCQPDACLNLEGLQISVPDGYDSDAGGTCMPHDECDNVDGIQNDIPDNMLRGEANDCEWDIAPLALTEVFPNAVGSDTGNEFIEIYNPTDHVVDLGLYSIKTGLNSDKTYTFPTGSTIAPGEYRAFADTSMKFTLLNTSSRVTLTAVDGSTLSDTGVYSDPADGESWAYIANGWEYTDHPTPGTPNTSSIIKPEVTDTTDTGLAACPVGKYRNPLTNRCRSIAADTVVLASCGADQYRNPETGRCKKIDTNFLAPCKDGQYRSEETNRCRNILAASTAKPCKDNQYRSEETNRCRNLPSSSVPDAAFAVQPVKDTGMAFVGWWAFGGIGLLAVGYGVWEWRPEIKRQLTKVISFFSNIK